MQKEVLLQIYNTLQQIEVKGFDNIDKMFGVMYTIRECLAKEEETKETE